MCTFPNSMSEERIRDLMIELAVCDAHLYRWQTGDDFIKYTPFQSLVPFLTSSLDNILLNFDFPYDPTQNLDSFRECLKHVEDEVNDSNEVSVEHCIVGFPSLNSVFHAE